MGLTEIVTQTTFGRTTVLAIEEGFYPLVTELTKTARLDGEEAHFVSGGLQGMRQLAANLSADLFGKSHPLHPLMSPPEKGHDQWRVAPLLPSSLLQVTPGDFPRDLKDDGATISLKHFVERDPIHTKTASLTLSARLVESSIVLGLSLATSSESNQTSFIPWSQVVIEAFWGLDGTLAGIYLFSKLGPVGGDSDIVAVSRLEFEPTNWRLEQMELRDMVLSQNQERLPQINNWPPRTLGVVGPNDWGSSFSQLSLFEPFFRLSPDYFSAEKMPSRVKIEIEKGVRRVAAAIQHPLKNIIPLIDGWFR